MGPFKRASEEEIGDYKEYLKKEKVRFEKFYNDKIKYDLTLDNFERLLTLEAGSFGSVILVRLITDNKYYALRTLRKEKIVATLQVSHTLCEKKVLQAVNHPFIVHMDYYFQDNSHLYFVLPFVVGGGMFEIIRKLNVFEEELARFYAAQVCLGLEYLHYLHVIYRDLKPENILIDQSGYLKISGFGFSKQITGKTWTLCGTPEYLAPEIVLSHGYHFAADWWSFGILIYEMNTGSTPFQDKDLNVLYNKIVAGHYKVLQYFSPELKDILKHLLQTNLSKRIGNLKNGAGDIKGHRWFKTINWLALLNKKMVPPFKPPMKDVTKGEFEKFADNLDQVSDTDEFAEEFAEF